MVHLEHGVGRYAGMTTLEAGGITGEYLMLTYANDAKLYVPVSSLHLISRYAGGAEENAPLHKLGGDAWSRARQKAAEKVRDVAAELLDIYAQRAAKEGFAFKRDREQYQLFCDSFPFETTPDQAQAINAVLSDMCQPLAMDRLVCGDVGFGKTEVAMRAAFLAVDNHKQVAVSCLPPFSRSSITTTSATVLPTGRYVSNDLPFPQRQRADANPCGVAEGKIDILIGTHKLLQSDVKFKDLGLLIVDEEHRFGVRHKERIKAMRANVDILTLTATPIPRTLNMAMSGMRDLSIIATPPARRLAVKTFVREYDSLVVREAILREILRGGRFIISTMMWKTSRKLPNGWQNSCLKHGLPSVTGRCASANWNGDE
ncbi:DEAD/DEAH box helicase [Escherichia coli]